MAESNSEFIQSPGEAHEEANMVKDVFAPDVKAGFKAAAKADPENKTLNVLAEKLEDTGYLEMGQQKLDYIKSESPDLYEALVTRQDAIDRFAQINAKRRQTTIVDSRKTATVIIDQADQGVKGKELDFSQDYEMQLQTLVSKEIAKAVEYKKDLTPVERGALVQGVWATLDINKQVASLKLAGKGKSFIPDIERVVEKHNKFVTPKPGK